MKYEDVAKTVFAEGIVPDGYFGEELKVGFALVEDRIIEVAPCGYFPAGLPDVLDECEAFWMLTHHPSARHIKSVVEVSGRECDDA